MAKRYVLPVESRYERDRFFNEVVVLLNRFNSLTERERYFEMKLAYQVVFDDKKKSEVKKK